MPYEWDEAKRRGNIEKHGEDFTLIDAFDWETATSEADPRQDEPRILATGFVGSRLHVIVYTWRGENIRVISLRKANDREARRYAETQTAHHLPNA